MWCRGPWRGWAVGVRLGVALVLGLAEATSTGGGPRCVRATWWRSWKLCVVLSRGLLV